MRSLIVLAAALAASPVLANPHVSGDDARVLHETSTAPGNTTFGSGPRVVRGETIVIEGKAPPRTAPRPVKDYHRIVPPYSDKAITSDVWAKAWLLLDIDTRGSVTRVKLLNKPGHDLDRIAIDQAFKLQFKPALDAHGNPTRSQLVWPIEWPSYWYMIDLEGVATRIPPTASRVPCKGESPLNFSMFHPTLRDCSPPALAKIKTEAWIDKR